MTVARKPVVGVVGHGYLVPKPFGDLPVTGTPPPYLESIAAAGGRPIVLAGRYAADQLDLVDAVVLTGGGDLEPARYGGTGAAEDVDPVRDEHELTLARAAVAAGVPLLGVCRGMQIMAVAFGGTLHGGLAHRIPDGGHEVRTEPGSRVHHLLGPRPRTSALHRQAVLDPGPRWRATAWADDGTVEAIEPTDPGLPALGVQWHPELACHELLDDATGPALFGWLVSRHREERSGKLQQESA